MKNGIEIKTPVQLLREKNQALLQCARILEKIVESINRNQIQIVINARDISMVGSQPAVNVSSGEFENIQIKADTVKCGAKGAR